MTFHWPDRIAGPTTPARDTHAPPLEQPSRRERWIANLALWSLIGAVLCVGTAVAVEFTLLDPPAAAADTAPATGPSHSALADRASAACTDETLDQAALAACLDRASAEAHRPASD